MAAAKLCHAAVLVFSENKCQDTHNAGHSEDEGGQTQGPGDVDTPGVVAHEESGQQVADVIAGHEEPTDRAGEIIVLL